MERRDTADLCGDLGRAAGPIGWFSVTFCIVLVGSGQAFFMAFGLDIPEFRNFPLSISSLLRMVVRQRSFLFTAFSLSFHCALEFVCLSLRSIFIGIELIELILHLIDTL